jgi:leucyl aminopeptidase
MPMTDFANIAFAPTGGKLAGTLVLLVGPDLLLGPMARSLGGDDLFRRAASAAEFTGKPRATMELLAPAGIDAGRIVLVGTGDLAAMSEYDWVRLGGVAMGVTGKAKAATVFFERPDGHRIPKSAAADFALGMKLRGYAFDRYKPDKDDDGSPRRTAVDVTIVVGDVAAARKAWAANAAIAGGVLLARDLINEPANVLGPVEFADHAKALTKLGVKVEVLGEAELRKLGMRALLGVAQGSPRPPRLVVMRWNGGRAKDQPVAFIGKGVVFDTGGISIKPAGNMEDMKATWRGRPPSPASSRRSPRARPRSTPSASSASSRTCRAAPPSDPATSSPL